MLRILIADDEELGRMRLRHLLAEHTHTQVIAECASGREAVSAIRRLSPDVALLDVCMPDLDGFDVLDALGEVRRPQIIFVTAHRGFALRAFEVQAVDYLLKPIDGDRLRTAVQRAREQIERQSEGPRPRTAHTSAALTAGRPATADHLVVRESGRLTVLKTADIEWVRAAGNYVELHLAGHTHLLRMAIGTLQTRLPPGQFGRISRSILVNLGCLKELCIGSHGDYRVLLENGTRLAGSRQFRTDLAGLLNRRR